MAMNSATHWGVKFSWVAAATIAGRLFAAPPKTTSVQPADLSCWTCEVNAVSSAANLATDFTVAPYLPVMWVSPAVAATPHGLSITIAQYTGLSSGFLLCRYDTALTTLVWYDGKIGRRPGWDR